MVKVDINIGNYGNDSSIIAESIHNNSMIKLFQNINHSN